MEKILFLSWICLGIVIFQTNYGFTMPANYSDGNTDDRSNTLNLPSDTVLTEIVELSSRNSFYSFEANQGKLYKIPYILTNENEITSFGDILMVNVRNETNNNDYTKHHCILAEEVLHEPGHLVVTSDNLYLYDPCSAFVHIFSTETLKEKCSLPLLNNEMKQASETVPLVSAMAVTDNGLIHLTYIDLENMLQVYINFNENCSVEYAEMAEITSSTLENVPHLASPAVLGKNTVVVPMAPNNEQYKFYSFDKKDNFLTSTQSKKFNGSENGNSTEFGMDEIWTFLTILEDYEIIVAKEGGILECINISSKHIIWNYKVDNGSEVLSEPVVGKRGEVVFLTNNMLVALDSNGKWKWSTSDDGESGNNWFGHPSISDTNTVLMFILEADGLVLNDIDIRNGDVLSKEKIPFYQVKIPPVITSCKALISIQKSEDGSIQIKIVPTSHSLDGYGWRKVRANNQNTGAALNNDRKVSPSATSSPEDFSTKANNEVTLMIATVENMKEENENQNNVITANETKGCYTFLTRKPSNNTQTLNNRTMLKEDELDRPIRVTICSNMENSEDINSSIQNISLLPFTRGNNGSERVEEEMDNKMGEETEKEIGEETGEEMGEETENEIGEETGEEMGEEIGEEMGEETEKEMGDETEEMGDETGEEMGEETGEEMGEETEKEMGDETLEEMGDEKLDDMGDETEKEIGEDMDKEMGEEIEDGDEEREEEIEDGDEELEEEIEMGEQDTVKEDETGKEIKEEYHENRTKEWNVTGDVNRSLIIRNKYAAKVEQSLLTPATPDSEIDLTNLATTTRLNSHESTQVSENIYQNPIVPENIYICFDLVDGKLKPRLSYTYKSVSDGPEEAINEKINGEIEEDEKNTKTENSRISTTVTNYPSTEVGKISVSESANSGDSTTEELGDIPESQMLETSTADESKQTTIMDRIKREATEPSLTTASSPKLTSSGGQQVGLENTMQDITTSVPTSTQAHIQTDETEYNNFSQQKTTQFTNYQEQPSGSATSSEKIFMPMCLERNLLIFTSDYGFITEKDLTATTTVMPSVEKETNLPLSIQTSNKIDISLPTYSPSKEVMESGTTPSKYAVTAETLSIGKETNNSITPTVSTKDEAA